MVEMARTQKYFHWVLMNNGPLTVFCLCGTKKTVQKKRRGKEYHINGFSLLLFLEQHGRERERIERERDHTGALAVAETREDTGEQTHEKKYQNLDHRILSLFLPSPFLFIGLVQGHTEA